MLLSFPLCVLTDCLSLEMQVDAWVFFSLSFLYSFLCMEGHVEDCSRDLYFFLIHFEDYFAFFKMIFSFCMYVYLCLSIYFSLYISPSLFWFYLSLSLSHSLAFSPGLSHSPLSSNLTRKSIFLARRTNPPGILTFQLTGSTTATRTRVPPVLEPTMPTGSTSSSK